MSEKGQTLTEILIAVATTGVAIVALLYGVANSVLAVNSVSNTRTAMNIARSQMEYIQAQSFDSEPNDSDIHYLQLPKRSLPDDWGAADSIQIDAEQKADYLQKITVTVNYVKSDAVVEDYKPAHSLLTYALFANTDSINVQGSGWQLQGDVVSKSTITVPVGSVNGNPEPNSSKPSPISYQVSDFGSPVMLLDADDFEPFDNAVDLNDLKEPSKVWLDWNPATKTGTRLKPGVYLTELKPGGSRPKIKLSRMVTVRPDGTRDPTILIGDVTFIAGSIEITGYNIIMSPYKNGVLAFTTGSGTTNINLSVSNSILSGVLYAPGGQININTGTVDIDTNGDGNSDTSESIVVKDNVFAGMAVAKGIYANGIDSSIGF